MRQTKQQKIDKALTLLNHGRCFCTDNADNGISDECAACAKVGCIESSQNACTKCYACWCLVTGELIYWIKPTYPCDECKKRFNL